MTAKLLFLAALATPSIAQISDMPMQCGGVRIFEEERGPLQPRSFAIQDRGFCSEYTLGAGIENTLQLHLGEGANAYLDQIYDAIQIWRDALFSGASVSEVTSGFPIVIAYGISPRNFTVSEAVWRERETISDRLVQDGQSVIYCTSSGNVDTDSIGFTRVRKSGNRIVEADIYINVKNEARHGVNLSRPRLGASRWTKSTGSTRSSTARSSTSCTR